MNSDAILTLISNLYTQIVQQQQRIAELENHLNPKPEPKD